VTHGRLLPAWLVVAAVLLAPSGAAGPTPTPPTTAPPEYPAPAASAPEKWQLEPLVLIGSEAPETGGRFEELGRPQWLESGYLFFWGRYGKKGSDSGFFSLKDGRVSAAALGKGYGRDTVLFAGKSKVFLAQATSFTGLVSPRFPRVWDGERLTTVLTERDEIELGGVRYQAWYGQVEAVSGDEARIRYFTKQPRKTTIYALYDGKGVSPLFEIGKEPLPAGPGFRGVGVFSQVFASGSYFAVLTSSGAADKKGLFRLTRETATLILALGEKDPLDPKYTIGSISAIEADRPDRVAIHARRSFEGKAVPYHVVYLWVDGRFRHVYTTAGEGSTGGTFLSPEMPHYLLRVVETRDVDRKTAIKSLSFLLFDGERLTNLTGDIWSEKEPVPMEAMPQAEALRKGEGQTRRMTGDFNGLLLAWVKRVANSTGEEKKPRFEPAWWFLDITAKPLRFRPAPEFTTVDGRGVMLADVLAWVRPGAALVQLPEGYFLLSKQQSN
jgi:hypothetical protein